MATTKEIRGRITSVVNTKKITNAMYLISSTKLRKAREELERTRPFFRMVENEIKRIFQAEEDVESPYFYPETGRKPAQTYAYLVVTADKGLVGAYNYNVIRRAEKEITKHKKHKLYVVGEYGRRYFKRHSIPIEQSFLFTAQNPTLRRAREISATLLEQYDTKNVDEIRVIYSDMINEMEAVVKMVRLLPFERTPFLTPDEEISKKDLNYKFCPSVSEVIDQTMPLYITGFVYGALVDSFSAEQNARMNAMNSANQNAEELMEELRLEYNQVRQAAITQEITEIAAGARAQRRKKEKLKAKAREEAQA